MGDANSEGPLSLSFVPSITITTLAHAACYNYALSVELCTQNPSGHGDEAVDGGGFMDPYYSVLQQVTVPSWLFCGLSTVQTARVVESIRYTKFKLGSEWAASTR
ncbi:hypothetical protein L218DRAFT_949154 [Marasmius fiardii PR-910]|nr:hypothetical protein L218DRAFT_949154 [Marasmius fiardii PR-910]